MGLGVLGMAEEFRNEGIAFNALWPRTAIVTSAVDFALTGGDSLRFCRRPEIVADAPYRVFTQPVRDFTGQFLIDDTFLFAEGVEDFSPYSVEPLMPDLFVPAIGGRPSGVTTSGS